MSVLQLFTFWFAVIIHLTYVATVWFVFRRDGESEDPVGLKILKVVALTSKLLLLFGIRMANGLSAPTYYVAICFFILSYSLFWSAYVVNKRRPLTLAFSNDLPVHLVQRGPYKFIRHPFYCSYLISYLACVIATGNALYLVIFLVMLGVYIAAAKREEAKFETSLLASEYLKYKNRTGFFVPRLSRKDVS